MRGEPGEECGRGHLRSGGEVRIQPGSRVVSAEPFAVQPMNGFGLQIRFSDGSSVLILPTPPEPDEPGEENLPPLADWELISPHGLLCSDPGLQWAFEPSVRKQPPEVVRPLPGRPRFGFGPDVPAGCD